MANYFERAQALREELVENRRYFHTHAEAGLHMPVAKAYILEDTWQIFVGCLLSLVALFPHELLHAVCFREDVYLYTNLKQGMLFVVGPEDMSRARFVFMSLLPNLVFGFLPYVLGMLFPQCVFLLAFGALNIGSGAGDYYNVFNALTQMPKGARTYLHGFHSYWYIPKD